MSGLRKIVIVAAAAAACLALGAAVAGVVQSGIQGTGHTAGIEGSGHTAGIQGSGKPPA